MYNELNNYGKNQLYKLVMLLIKCTITMLLKNDNSCISAFVIPHLLVIIQDHSMSNSKGSWVVTDYNVISQFGNRHNFDNYLKLSDIYCHKLCKLERPFGVLSLSDRLQLGYITSKLYEAEERGTFFE